MIVKTKPALICGICGKISNKRRFVQIRNHPYIRKIMGIKICQFGRSRGHAKQLLKEVLDCARTDIT